MWLLWGVKLLKLENYIVLSRMRCHLGFKELMVRIEPQKREIYKIKAVPQLQISKEVDFLMIYVRFRFSRKYGDSVNPEIHDFG